MNCPKCENKMIGVGMNDIMEQDESAKYGVRVVSRGVIMECLEDGYTEIIKNPPNMEPLLMIGTGKPAML